jgi:hypothetical protein
VLIDDCAVLSNPVESRARLMLSVAIDGYVAIG